MSQNVSRYRGELADSAVHLAHYTRAARADGTLTVYQGIWRQWTEWCQRADLVALPARPEAVAAWLAGLAHAGKSLSSINVALSAVVFLHGAAGHSLERKHRAIAAIMAGIARCEARRERRAAPITTAELRALVASIGGDDLRSLRDRALILVGFWGALRRSEIAALDVEGRSPITLSRAGLLLHLTGTKTSARTHTLAIPRRDDAICAVAALERYLGATGLDAGPLFRPISKSGTLLHRRLNAASVRHILKMRVGKETPFSPHSLRAGFITSAAQAKAPEHIIQRTSRHKSVEVLRSYIRTSDAFAEAAANFMA